MANLGTPTKFTTFWILIIIALGLIGWDIYAAYSTTQPTISALTLAFAKKYVVVPYVFGVISGHLFWPQEVEN